MSKTSPPAAAPASEPVATPASAPVGFYSAQTMREVIAGCRLSVADERALTAKCVKRAEGLALRLSEITSLATSLNRWQWLGPLLAGGLALALGLATGFAVGFGLRLTASAP